MLDYKYFYDGMFHLNTEGANIRALQLADDLKRWKETQNDASVQRDAYSDIVSDVNLSHITNVYEYFDALVKSKDRYTIVTLKANDYPLNERNNMCISERLKGLGLLSNGFNNNACYAGIIESGIVNYESTGEETVTHEGSFDKEMVRYSVLGLLDKEGSHCSIMLNGQEYARNNSDLNVVVYSNETHRILDEVAIKTYDLSFSRKDETVLSEDIDKLQE